MSRDELSAGERKLLEPDLIYVEYDEWEGRCYNEDCPRGLVKPSEAEWPIR